MGTGRRHLWNLAAAADRIRFYYVESANKVCKNWRLGTKRIDDTGLQLYYIGVMEIDLNTGDQIRISNISKS